MSKATEFDPRKHMLCDLVDNGVIYVTEDYDMFRQQHGNRNRGHKDVNPMVEAIRDCDLLRYQPILINEKLEVIDGQTRLRSARSLNKPVYFIVGEGLAIRETQILNTNLQPWKLLDFLHSHIDAGNENYVKLQAFISKWSLSVSKGVKLYD